MLPCSFPVILSEVEGSSVFFPIVILNLFQDPYHAADYRYYSLVSEIHGVFFVLSCFGPAVRPAQLLSLVRKKQSTPGRTAKPADLHLALF